MHRVGGGGSGIQDPPPPPRSGPDYHYFLSHARQQMPEKTNTGVANSSFLGLKVDGGKNKLLKNNAAASMACITLGSDALEEVTNFTSLG